MSAGLARPATEVFQQSFSLERQWVKEVVRAVLGAILFHRSLGNLVPSSFECAGVTFPVPAEAEVEALLTTKVEAFARAVQQQTTSAELRCSRLVVALYPTPAAPRQVRPPAPKPRTIAPTVTSALGWFSASAKALATGAEEDESALDDDLGPPWEAWVLDFEAVSEGRRGISEEKLRQQLNQFLLRSLEFVMNRTTHVPPITTADLQPFGLQILIDPPALSLAVPKAIVSPSSALFPLLHHQLVSPTRSAPNLDGRREGYAAYGQ